AVDLAFTDRMLINLSSAQEQLEAMERIASVVRPGGLFLMIENSVQTHRALNEARAALGLPFRPPAEFNVFIDEDRVIRPFQQRLDEPAGLLEKALREEAGHRQARSNLVAVLTARGNRRITARELEAAVADLQRAVALDPAAAEAQMALGLALMGLARFDEA